MINGVIVRMLKRISDDRGTISKMLQSSDLEYRGFGEVYFSSVYPGKVKGWNLHQRTTLNYVVIKGMIKLVLFDNRNQSSTKGTLQELFIGDRNYCLVQIPPEIWYGFTGIGTEEAIIADLTDLPYDPDEITRLDPLNNSLIPYSW